MVYYQRNRYFKTKKVTNKGGRWDSKFEACYADELEMRKRGKDIVDYDSHVRIPLEVNGYHICNYFIDFVVHYPDGLTEYVECKGYPTEVWRLKWKLFEALYSDKPDVKLTVEMQGKFRPPKARKVKK